MWDVNMSHNMCYVPRFNIAALDVNAYILHLVRWHFQGTLERFNLTLATGRKEKS